MLFLPALLLYGLGLSWALARRGLRHPEEEAEAAPAAVDAAPRRLLIVGATGGTGRQLVAQALERGFEVTALARNPAKLAETHPRLTVLQGDVLQPDSLDAALRGQHAVLSALGHKQFFRPTRIQSAGTRNLLQAMERQGVRRFIGATSLGLGDSAFAGGLVGTFLVFPLILPFYFWDKALQERVIAASSREWTIVRPGALTNGPRRPAVARGRAVGNWWRGVRVSRADTAAFMLDQLTDGSFLRMAPGIGD